MRKIKKKDRRTFDMNKRPNQNVTNLLKDKLWHVSRRCYVCGLQLLNRKYVSLEHIIPLGAGGTNALSNLALSHVECNLQKARTTDDQLIRGKICE
jgi:5-methylcytosine-specific restriction endonuclease McrA